VIFKQVGEGRPYPDHARTTREWAEVPPRPVRLDQLITTKAVLDLRLLLSKDSTFYGDLFPHVIHWRGELYRLRGPAPPAAALTQAGKQYHGLNRGTPG
jgi:Arc/MetJ family transcription regulator